MKNMKGSDQYKLAVKDALDSFVQGAVDINNYIKKETKLGGFSCNFNEEGQEIDDNGSIVKQTSFL